MRGHPLDPLLGGDGVQVFVSEGVGVDEELVEQEARTVIRDELCSIIKHLSAKQGCISVSHTRYVVHLLLLLLIATDCIFAVFL